MKSGSRLFLKLIIGSCLTANAQEIRDSPEARLTPADSGSAASYYYELACSDSLQSVSLKGPQIEKSRYLGKTRRQMTFYGERDGQPGVYIIAKKQAQFFKLSSFTKSEFTDDRGRLITQYRAAITQPALEIENEIIELSILGKNLPPTILNIRYTNATHLFYEKEIRRLREETSNETEEHAVQEQKHSREQGNVYTLVPLDSFSSGYSNPIQLSNRSRQRQRNGSPDFGDSIDFSDHNSSREGGPDSSSRSPSGPVGTATYDPETDAYTTLRDSHKRSRKSLPEARMPV